MPGSVLLLAGGGGGGVRGVRLELVVELGDVGQDGETVGRASSNVRHVQQGRDPQPGLGSLEGSVAVPGKMRGDFIARRSQGQVLGWY